MRLFVALDIDHEIRERITRFTQDVRNFAPEARWVKEESLHITLKFIGEQPESKVEQIKQTLATVAIKAGEIRFRGYGFFPTARAARVFWIGLEGSPELAELASAVEGTLTSIGIPKEERKFSPHLTLARSPGRSGSPRRLKEDRATNTFARLRQQLTPVPALEFGSMTPPEFFLYKSQLSPKGSTYTKLARFSLQPRNI